MILPNYHHLLYFREIARLGTISKASEKLRIGQPSLSVQLKQLELFFGTKLFHRLNKKMVLTETGEMALIYAEKIYELGLELSKTLEDKSLEHRPTFALGALDCIPKTVIYEVSKKLTTLGGHFLSIREGNGQTMIRELHYYHLDAFITNNLLDLSSDRHFVTHSLTKLPVSIYGSSKYLGLKNNFPDSLNNIPFIVPTHDSKLRIDIEHFFQLHSISPRFVAEVQDTSVMKLYGIDGTGVFPIVDSAIDPSIREKDLYKIGTLSNIYEEYFFVTLKRDIEGPILNKIHKALKQGEIIL